MLLLLLVSEEFKSTKIGVVTVLVEV